MASQNDFAIRPVADDQWPILGWLWQAYRSDMAPFVHGLPYADGRYQARGLDRLPDPDAAAYIAWRAHPNTREDAPIGFIVIDGLGAERRMVADFWIAPAARRGGVGRCLATEVIAMHDGPWDIPFQQDNTSAGAFWRAVADSTFGTGNWSEERRAVPHKPDAPADHWISSS